MKCQRCSGNGKYKTIFGNTIICDFCYGTGEITYGDDDKIEPIGNKKPMTNEEWLRQASTEDVAKWLSKISKFFHECGKRDVYPKTMYEEDWEWWLKEIHLAE